MPLLFTALLLFSLACTFFAYYRVKNKIRLCLIVLFGLPIIWIAFPVTAIMINSLLQGTIEKHMPSLWSVVTWLVISDGDIYMGAGGFILLLLASMFLTIQMLLTQSSKP